MGVMILGEAQCRNFEQAGQPSQPGSEATGQDQGRTDE